MQKLIATIVCLLTIICDSILSRLSKLMDVGSESTPVPARYVKRNPNRIRLDIKKRYLHVTELTNPFTSLADKFTFNFY